MKKNKIMLINNFFTMQCNQENLNNKPNNFKIEFFQLILRI